MIDIVDRLRFDAARCEVEFSRGVASNIEAAAAEIERLRAALDCALLEHDSQHGQFRPDFMPNHWTHEARRLLAGNEQMAGHDPRDDFSPENDPFKK